MDGQQVDWLYVTNKTCLYQEEDTNKRLNEGMLKTSELGDFDRRFLSFPDVLRKPE